MLQRSKWRQFMAAATKPEVTRAHARGPSFVSLLSGWAQQGVQSFFSSQRVILDLAMRQNASVMQALRQQLTDPNHSPTMILGEMAGEGMSNIIEGHKVLLQLAQEQNEILMQGVKEQIGTSPAAQAVADLFQRSVDTFIDMQQEFLKIAGKQTHSWVEATKTGKPYQPEHIAELAREGMENFIKAQKQFLDIVADETAKATGAKSSNGAMKKKKTELSELTRQATNAFIEAQKKLFDVAGKQMNTNVKVAGKTLELLRPFPFLPLGELTREGVKSYVDAQKSLMEVMLKQRDEHKHEAKAPHRKRPVRAKKAAASGAA
jgi:hypothetical protein